MEKFLIPVANVVDSIYFSLIIYISKDEVVQFRLNWYKNRPIKKYSDYYFEDFDPEREKFLITELDFFINFYIYELSTDDIDYIETNKNLFTEFIRNDQISLIILHSEVKNFIFDFRYYGKIL